MDDSKVHEMPTALAREMIDAMAYLRMVPETRGLLSRCDARDALIVTGDDLRLRLELLAIDEGVDMALMDQGSHDSSKGFERLLSRFDALVCTELIHFVLSHRCSCRPFTCILQRALQQFIIRGYRAE